MRKDVSKKLFILFLVFFISLLNISNVDAESEDIKVYVDSDLVEFEVAPIILEGRSMVPFRDIFEYFGARVSWNDKNQILLAKRDDLEIKLKIGEEFALVEDKKQKLDVVPKLIDGEVLVPLKFVAESYGLNTKWIGSKKEIKIYSELLGISNGEKEIKIGDSLNRLKSVLGEPSRIDQDLMKTEWYIYNNKANSYKDFIMVAVRDKRVVGFKTNSMNWRLSDEIKVNEKYLGQDYYKKINEHYKSKEQYMEVSPYIKGNVINSIAAYEKNPDYAYRNITIKEGDSRFTYYRPILKEKYSQEGLGFIERQIFDLTNVLRINKGLKPLEWNKDLANIARNHNKDMSKNDYFAHGSDKMSFQDRMQPYLIKHNWNVIGENLVLGVHDSFGYINSWYNSDAHRVNLLSNKFDKLGVSGYYNKEKSHIYFTQNFAK